MRNWHWKRNTFDLGAWFPSSIRCDKVTAVEFKYCRDGGGGWGAVDAASICALRNIRLDFKCLGPMFPQQCRRTNMSSRPEIIDEPSANLFLSLKSVYAYKRHAGSAQTYIRTLESLSIPLAQISCSTQHSRSSVCTILITKKKWKWNAISADLRFCDVICLFRWIPISHD